VTRPNFWSPCLIMGRLHREISLKMSTKCERSSSDIHWKRFVMVSTI
jgi:hypothetical protein